ncbi:MAG: (Fe-S)-binding protein [Thermodesulfobacteriota bacterium]
MTLARLKSLEDEMKKCFRCSLCKMIPLPVVASPAYSDGCPAARRYHFHGYSGSGKQIMALSLIDGRISADADLAEIVFACTTCGLCDVACKFIMEAERHQVNMALREYLVEQGVAPRAIKERADRLQQYSHLRKRADIRSGDWARDLGLKVLPVDKAGVLLYPDFLASGAGAAAAAGARKTAAILRAAGVDFGILGDQEPDSGLFAYWTGHRELFTRLAENTLGKLNHVGVETVVVTSGATLGLIRSKYPEYAGQARVDVLHVTEYIERLLREGRLTLPRAVNHTVTYHDPCYLGRQSEPPVVWQGEKKVDRGCMTYTSPPRPVNTGANGVYEAPRSILRAIDGLNFKEMWRIREYAFCCGGGGGVPDAFPRLAESAAAHRLAEAADTGADLLVTACDHCLENFNRCGEGSGEKRIPVKNIVDLVYEAMNPDAARSRL